MDKQREICEMVNHYHEKYSQGKGSTKIVGDIVCRIFMKYIADEIPKNYKVIGPNAYIAGFSTEFDLLITKSDARPVDPLFVNAYSPAHVKFGLEIKYHGVIGNKEGVNKQLSNIKETFENIHSKHANINFIYLTYNEVWKPKRKTSIDYFKLTADILKPFSAYCLVDSRSKEQQPGEWERFINELNGHLKKG